MNAAPQKKPNRSRGVIRLIIEQSDESIDFGDFMEEVVNFKESSDEVGVNKGPSENKG